MRSSISPPYPKDLQILHDLNYVDPISPLFKKNIEILKNKTFDANEKLINHKMYLETLKEAYQKEKNKFELIYNEDKKIADENHVHQTEVASQNMEEARDRSVGYMVLFYKNLISYLQKIFDNFLGIINGNIGAIICGIIVFIVFIILILWIFNVISLPPGKKSSSDDKSLTSSYKIPNKSELIPNGDKGYTSDTDDDEDTFSFNNFIKNKNKLNYINKSLNKEIATTLDNNPLIQNLKTSLSSVKDSISDSFFKNETIQDEERTIYSSQYYHFHNELYLPIDNKKQIALFKPKNYPIEATIDSKYDEYKFLISKITSYSLDDFSKIIIIFKKYEDDNIHQHGFLKIDKIVSKNNDKIIFYDHEKTDTDNILNVIYEKSKIGIKFNQKYFKSGVDKIANSFLE